MDMLLDLPFDLLHPLQSLIPASLQLIGYQPVFRIRRIVLLVGSLRRIARRFQVSPQGFQDFVLLARFFFAGQYRRLHRRRLHDAQHPLG